MAETKTQTARRRALDRRSHTSAGAKAIGAEQESALRRGYTATPMPASKPRPVYREAPQTAPGPPATADVMGGAQHDPNIEITVGPDGKVVRRRRNP